MPNSKTAATPRSRSEGRHRPAVSLRAGGGVARAAPPADGGTLLNALIEVPGAARGDEQPSGAPLLLDELAELLPAPQIDEIGVLAQFDPPTGAAASEAVPLELIRSKGATGYMGVKHDARSANRPYLVTLKIGGRDLYLGAFASAEEAATAYALAVRRASEPHGCAVALERKLAAAQRKLEVAERKLEVAQRYVPTRRRAAFLAEIADADADAADADADAADADAAYADAAYAKPAKRQRGETAAEKQKRLKKLAKDIVRGANGKAPRELNLSELRFVVASSNPPKELTTLVLRAYLYAAGRKPATFASSTKVYYAGELIGIIESEKATAAKWSPAAGKAGELEFR